MLNFNRPIKLTLKTGETVKGQPNYVSETHVEIITDAGEFRWIAREDLA